MDRSMAPVMLARAALLWRTAGTVAVTGAGLGLVEQRGRLAATLALIVAANLGGLWALFRRPQLVRHTVAIIVLDTLLVGAAMLASRGGLAYFCSAVGASALAGVLLSARVPLVAVPHAVLGYLVAVDLLHDASYPSEISAFVLAFPMADVLAGVGGAVAAVTLARQLDLAAEVLASARRSAAASERARLARELHDSVAKTLRGVSFAALALPTSWRRDPAMAEKLASTVSEGASAAAREARELLDGMRLDDPDRDFVVTVFERCERWVQAAGIPVRLTSSPCDPPVEVRYELGRVLQEALSNVARHSGATMVEVELLGGQADLRLRVTDNGCGFTLPQKLSALRAGQHYGILGMHERVRAIGGTLLVESAPGSGTTVQATIPVAGT
jgi:signal transduction histidine kinase